MKDAVSTAGSTATQVRDAVVDGVAKTVDGVRDLETTVGSIVGSPAKGGGSAAPGGSSEGHSTSPEAPPTAPDAVRRAIGRAKDSGASGTALGAPISEAPDATIIESLLVRNGVLDALGSRIGGIGAEVAKRLAFPLALLLIVMVFLLVHHRIDRREPKLAIAPVAVDLTRFA